MYRPDSQTHINPSPTPSSILKGDSPYKIQISLGLCLWPMAYGPWPMAQRFEDGRANFSRVLGFLL